MMSIAKAMIVMHHPHTTGTTGTWRNERSTVNKALSSVEGYAGAGQYYEPDRKKSKYDSLNEVLKATKKSETVDFTVRRNEL